MASFRKSSFVSKTLWTLRQLIAKSDRKVVKFGTSCALGTSLCYCASNLVLTNGKKHTKNDNNNKSSGVCCCSVLLQQQQKRTRLPLSSKQLHCDVHNLTVNSKLPRAICKAVSENFTSRLRSLLTVVVVEEENKSMEGQHQKQGEVATDDDKFTETFVITDDIDAYLNLSSSHGKPSSIRQWHAGDGKSSSNFFVQNNLVTVLMEKICSMFFAMIMMSDSLKVNAAHKIDSEKMDEDNIKEPVRLR